MFVYSYSNRGYICRRLVEDLFVKTNIVCHYLPTSSEVLSSTI